MIVCYYITYIIENLTTEDESQLTKTLKQFLVFNIFPNEINSVYFHSYNIIYKIVSLRDNGTNPSQQMHHDLFLFCARLHPFIPCYSQSFLLNFSSGGILLSSSLPPKQLKKNSGLPVLRSKAEKSTVIKSWCNDNLDLLRFFFLSSSTDCITNELKSIDQTKIEPEPN